MVPYDIMLQLDRLRYIGVHVAELYMNIHSAMYRHGGLTTVYSVQHFPHTKIRGVLDTERT